jgi:hypothetical protein
MLRRTISHGMKYSNLELTTRGEFPHGMSAPGFVPKLDKNIPGFYRTYRSMYFWPVLGDNWDAMDTEDKHHDLHMFYTLAWWKMGEGIMDDSDPEL